MLLYRSLPLETCMSRDQICGLRTMMLPLDLHYAFSISDGVPFSMQSHRMQCLNHIIMFPVPLYERLQQCVNDAFAGIWSHRLQSGASLAAMGPLRSFTALNRDFEDHMYTNKTDLNCPARTITIRTCVCTYMYIYILYTPRI